MTFALGSAALALALLVPASGKPDESLVCNLQALNRAERDRHELLSERLGAAVVHVRELSNGYELALDLSRLPKDARGAAFCVAEVAEWVDLEARCCPFLDFAIGVRGRGADVPSPNDGREVPSHNDGREVVLSLTGGANVKAFLNTELPLLERAAK